MIDETYDPFDDEAPGTITPGAVADYDPFDDDESAADAPLLDFAYYDSEAYYLRADDARTPFETIIEATFRECPVLSSRSDVAAHFYSECPALAGADIDNLSAAILSEIKDISDKLVRLGMAQYRDDERELKAASRAVATWRDDMREDMLATGRDLVDIAHEQGAALHDFDKTARSLGYGWDWSADKNRLARQARGGAGKSHSAQALITRAQAAAVAPDDTPAAVKPAPVKVITQAVVKPAVIAPPREIIKPAPRKPKSTFKKLVTMNNAGRVVKDKSTFPDRRIIADPMPARGDYRKPPAVDDSAGNVPDMFQDWMAARGKVSYHKGQTATKLPAYLLKKSS
jgi:hypothetical protein